MGARKLVFCAGNTQRGLKMEIAELFLKAWPVLLGIVTLIVVLSKLDLRVAVLEEKVKSAFEIINKMRDKQ
jgi:hypothetical protein